MSLPSSSFPPLDSLPYLDPPSHPDYAAYALTLIEAEMSRMSEDPSVDTTAARYLSGVRSYTPSFSAVVSEDLRALSSNGGEAPVRPSPRPIAAAAPKGALAGDVQAWRSAVSKSKSALEGGHAELVNLELLASFGQGKWKAYLEDLTGAKGRAEGRVKEVLLGVDGVNAGRKATQEEAKAGSDVMTRKFYELAAKNAHLKGAIEEERRKRQKTK
eukprot:CAMPEP_0182462754 /NCGR_PEP_ID=MMETSP1319-20130603/6906_1 /TAXON_ID=172717 /ORGANISM="Bolidomonas pacifica, Strain RCC208" /LENGTH=214 /DNA_ID=CAMNT_0024662211 /DNA_START=258 /DNA_END=902 /DNA_ORIENTATION=-